MSGPDCNPGRPRRSETYLHTALQGGDHQAREGSLINRRPKGAGEWTHL